MILSNIENKIMSVITKVVSNSYFRGADVCLHLVTMIHRKTLHPTCKTVRMLKNPEVRFTSE